MDEEEENDFCREAANPSFNPLTAFHGVPITGNPYYGSYSSGSIDINGESLPKLDEATKKAIVLGFLIDRRLC